MTSPLKDEFSFSGKTVIVTGGNGGIGHGLAAAFSERGANIVIADFTPALQPIGSSGTGEVVDIRTDITDRSAVDAMIAETMRRFGRIDVLVNNAGRGTGFARLPEVTAAITDELVQLNIYGTINCTQAAAVIMIAQKSGSIVNISSNAALSGFAGRHDPIYAGCKGFINAFTKSLAADLGEHNIRVNTIAPGWIVPEHSQDVSRGSFWETMRDSFGTPDSFNAEYARTGQLHAVSLQALQRLGRPRDIAAAAVYFASDAARHVTGQILSIGGGDYMPS